MPRKPGPRTAVGKAIVRLNAVRHGLASADVVIPGLERVEDWLAFRAAMLESLAPEGAVEEDLAEHVAATAWRRRRVPPHEAQIIAVAIERAPEELARKFAWHDAPSVEELEAGLVRNRAALALLERLARPASAGDAHEDAGACVELLLAAAGDDATLLEDLPGVPAWDTLEAFDEWTRPLVMSILKALAMRVGTRLPRLLEGTGRRLNDGLDRRRAALAEAHVELDRLRRERALPEPPVLQSIARYEAHLDRQYYRALHELQVLQSFRRGEPLGLSRIEVHGLPGA